MGGGFPSAHAIEFPSIRTPAEDSELMRILVYSLRGPPHVFFDINENLYARAAPPPV